MSLSDRPLAPDELAEFKSFSALGLGILGLSATAPSANLVKAVNAYVDAWQKEEKSLPEAEVIDTALALGIVWGDQLVREFGWEWRCVLNGEDERYAVVTKDRALAIYATYFVKECLDHPTADCTAMLAFNMISAGKVSGTPGSYLSVMKHVRRIVPKG